MRPEWPAPSPLKDHWLLSKELIFLNHGSFGACPKPVLAAQTRLREIMETSPLQFIHRHRTERMDEARNVVAPFVGADPANFVFVTNATTAVNAVLRSLELAPGDEILTTDHDYNACRNVLVEVARRTGARIVVAHVPFPILGEDQIVQAIVDAVTPRTRLALLDHVTSTTALVFPLERIIRELEARGVDTLVDGAHAPGMVPLALETLRPTYYTGNLHKWVCAPKGAAFLWVRPDKQDGLQPAVISHGNNTPRPGHSPFQDRFDWPATYDFTAWLCAAESVRWLGELLPGGWPELMSTNRQRAIEARRFLCERLGLEPPCPESMLGSMATLPMPGRLTEIADPTAPDPVYTRLHDEFGIELQIPRIHGQRWLRISSHAHNAADEYRYLADVLGRLTTK
ncbi:aminotransferase class V-fold PLP-dependent enzyme [Luteolibacter sp. LG18]|uniref:aminotransferase class V-fold PLP-dependent enzyme n=1 Tax=Luteolibacter sp. LG18 TaxID=2819286 RepID=UPI002B2F1C6F|nr:isopenicillin-N epimerase [Luteolibacter sp. LG18]